MEIVRNLVDWVFVPLKFNLSEVEEPSKKKLKNALTFEGTLT